eukprot:Lankesteria_metandrocarpae@DN10611_c0_g1_i1.p1
MTIAGMKWNVGWNLLPQRDAYTNHIIDQGSPKSCVPVVHASPWAPVLRMHQLRDIPQRITRTKFGPDGSVVAACGDRGFTVLYDLSTGTPTNLLADTSALRTDPPQSVFTGGATMDCSWDSSTGGTVLYTASADGALRCYDTRTNAHTMNYSSATCNPVRTTATGTTSTATATGTATATTGTATATTGTATATTGTATATTGTATATTGTATATTGTATATT